MAALREICNKNKYIWWYALCFALLGLIDQRRGSAVGNVQMTITNLTGPVLACMLLPSMKKEFVHTRLMLVWTIVCVIGIPVGMFLGRYFWAYAGQWNMAVVNVAIAGFLVLYIIWNWQEIKQKNRLNRGCLFLIIGMLLLMQCSVHETIWPIWFLGYFGCFYLIGISEKLEMTFVRGMLLGIIIWFFVQQIIAFGFRPYDYIRYRGLYSGETQNGLFYMIVFCAFTGMWFLLRKEKAKWFLKLLCFLLSAGSLGFVILTGGRSSLIGAVAAAVIGYILYDMTMLKSFKRWILQGILLGVCTILLFPAVYGCVRYLPTILHHPIWFEGEYDAENSVHSYDPWDSERYISFESAVNSGFGRIFRMFGIKFKIENGSIIIETPFSLTAHAAEEGEPGISKDNPFYFENEDYYSPMGARKTIYYLYSTHLNFVGHSKNQAGFYFAENGIYSYHAHNMYLQIAYDYGILPGVLFFVWNTVCFIRLIKQKNLVAIIWVTFFTAILVYGFAEMAVTIGQITLVLMFIIYYFGLKKPEKVEEIVSV